MEEERSQPSFLHTQRRRASNAEIEDEQMNRGNEEDIDMGFIGSLEPSFDDSVSEMMLMQIGSSGKSYQREGRTAMRKMISEIYSPPRVTKMLEQMRNRHVMPGFALDLTVVDPDDGKPWDFTVPEKRAKARRMLRASKPYILIGSPVCTQYSTWQALNRARFPDTPEKQRARVEAQLRLDFVISLYYEQLEGGRYFLHEHPYFATSWELESVERLMNVPGVQRQRGDQCQYGAQIMRGKDKGQPIMKPTGFMTNSHEVARALARRCSGQGGTCSRRKGGSHKLVSGAHAKDAARYPQGLCRAMIKGVME